MGNNKYFDELIASYLSNNLDTEEEAFVLDWINSSEQNKQYFEEVRTIWNLLSVNQAAKAINVDSEWDQFKQVISTKEKELSGNKLRISDDEITEQIKPNRKAKIYKFFISTAVAASIIVVIALGWRLANNNATIGESLAVKVNREKHSPASFMQYQYNTTDEVKQLVLQDGSEVLLYGKSRISFFKPFISNNRNITLVGKADFKVAKDKAKPFTVFSGDISTTALGTQFTVTAIERDKNIVVRLYEGKVVVKSASSEKRNLKRNFYLLPGQELVYDNKNLTAKVRTFRKEDNPVVKNNKRESVPIDNPSVPKFGRGSWYMFNNQPLEQVFNQLESMFNVDIVYTRKDISKIYFIGTFNISESLDSILKQISVLNNLKVTQKNNKYIITK